MSMSTDCCPRCGSVGHFTFIFPCRARPNQHHEWHSGRDTTAAVTNSTDPVPALEAEVATLRAALESHVASCATLTKQRDDARADCDHLGAIARSEAKHKHEAREQLDALRAERDEAVALLKKYVALALLPREESQFCAFHGTHPFSDDCEDCRCSAEVKKVRAAIVARRKA